MNWRCRLGFHDFQMPPHWQLPPPKGALYFGLDIPVECARGCGARRIEWCDPDVHWKDRHPEEGTP
jgi:hypothetical protein